MVKKILITGFILAFLAAAFFVFQFFRPAVHNSADSYFYIKPGENIATVKKNLIKEKFISGKNFSLAGKLLKYKIVKPGRYKFPDGINLINLVKMLRNGNQGAVKLVIIKERTKELFAGKFGLGKKYDFDFDSLQIISLLNNNDSLKEYNVDTNTVMGIVMPYTYEINWNSNPRDILEQFYIAFKRFWNDDRKEKADSLGLTPMQVMTLASIVEEESNKKEDKLNIASVYLNRLKIGMRLQADPTVKFATKNFGLKRILGSHLNISSPYNTYLNTGLPPGPVCTPSLSSIDAVLNAPTTDYLYFVASSKFDGSSVFASNYADHLKYARAYQQELTRRMDSSKKANATN